MNNTKKKILITGAAGFVGSHLTEFFIKKVTRLLRLTDTIVLTPLVG